LTIKRAYKEVYRKGLSVNDALVNVAALSDDMPELTFFAEFIRNSSRGIAR
jgi:UDP-N-acetylglucosamine acyltransferase